MRSFYVFCSEAVNVTSNVQLTVKAVEVCKDMRVACAYFETTQEAAYDEAIEQEASVASIIATVQQVLDEAGTNVKVAGLCCYDAYEPLNGEGLGMRLVIA
jgi:hypothetical protein